MLVLIKTSIANWDYKCAWKFKDH